MFAKLSTVFAVFAVAAQVAVAVPPACLIAAVNTQSDPSDIKSVCDGGASDVQKYMSSNCGDNLDTATSAFADVCKDAGVTVSSSTSSKTSSGTSSGTSTASHTGSSDSSAETTGTPKSSGTMTSGAVLPMGTAASSGFLTQTATNNGTYSAPSSASGSGSAQPTETGLTTSTGGAARLGMDIMGLAAVGIFGAMLAL